MAEEHLEDAVPPPGVPTRLHTHWQQVRTRPTVRRATSFYKRHKRYAPLVFFFGGVVWDALTLERIDAWFDNALLLLYLIVLGGLITVATLVEYNVAKDERLYTYRSWYRPAIQFFLGALFSAHVIFYFQSTSLTETSLFLVILIVLLIANEVIHERLFNLYLLLSLYFLVTFSFLQFFVPVVTKQMTYTMFLVGGTLSVTLTAGLSLYFKYRSVLAKWRQVGYAIGLVAALFGLLNVFYLQNWIPPVPIAMRYGGVFHHVSRETDGYLLRYETPAWYKFWIDSDERFRLAEGEAVYCFTAIFAPTRLTKQVYHQWSFFDEATQTWAATDRIPFEVIGGRFRGFRGYTFKRNVWPGRWRISVETEEGQIIGRVRFHIDPVSQPVTDLKEVLYE